MQITSNSGKLGEDTITLSVFCKSLEKKKEFTYFLESYNNLDYNILEERIRDTGTTLLVLVTGDKKEMLNFKESLSLRFEIIEIQGGLGGNHYKVNI